MRIDQIDRHEPWLTSRVQLTRLGTQPDNSGPGGKVVIGVSAERAVDQVAHSQEIRETVRFDDLTVLQQRGVHRPLRRIEIFAEMPLSLIGGVVSDLLQTMPDRHHVGGHIRLPGSSHVVEDAGMLDVLARVDG